MRARLERLWRGLRQPRVFLPVVLGGALLAAALGLSDVPRAFHRIAAIPLPVVLAVPVLASAYLVLKGLQFRGLLAALGIRARWRALVLSFAVGELSLTLPLGVYSQNYLLQRLRVASGWRSASVTTVMLMLETGVLFAALAALGVPGWTWVRPVAAACFVGLVASFEVLARSRGLRRLAVRATAHLPLGRGAPRAFLRGMRALGHGGLLLRRGALTVAYLAVLVAAFDLVAHGVGAAHLALSGAAAIYAFSLSMALLLGSVTTQLGVVEVAGMGAAAAAGYGPTEGLAMLLGFRLLWVASIWLLALPVVVALRKELRASGADGREEAGD